jgi:hypothetical protein
MLEYLRARGADVELLDSHWFPKDLGLSFDPLADHWTLTLPGGRRLDGVAIRSMKAPGTAYDDPRIGNDDWATAARMDGGDDDSNQRCDQDSRQHR